MKKFSLFLFSFLLALTAAAQSNFEPQVLILPPAKTSYDKSFKKEITAHNAYLKKQQKSDPAENIWSQEQPENIQRMIKSEAAFGQQLDIFRQISYIAEQYLAYRLLEAFPDLLILLKDQPLQENPTGLKSVADQEQIQYVLYFPQVELYKKQGASYARIQVQLFDRTSNSLLINKSYIGDWNNPGFEFACADQSVNCTINNALAQALQEVLHVVVSNSPLYQQRQQLQQQRAQVLTTQYLSRPFDREQLTSIISSEEENIEMAAAYQCLFSPDGNKFVAFFLQQVNAQDFKNLTENKKDQHVQILTKKNIKEEVFLGEIPKTYAYVVNGLRYNGKWYYEKAVVTYFEANSLEEGRSSYFNSLQKQDFFEEGSVEPDPAFWKKGAFANVESQVEKQAGDIPKLQQLKANAEDEEEAQIYQNTIDEFYEDDKKNQDYIGLPELVVNQLRREKRAAIKQFEASVSHDYLDPKLEILAKDPANKIKSFHTTRKGEYPLIFPSDRSVILTPIVAEDPQGQLKLHYYVLLPSPSSGYTLYQWTFFDYVSPKYKQMYGSEVIEQLGTLTSWDFSYDTLDDPVFWKEHVLKKEGTSYKYLRKIN